VANSTAPSAQRQCHTGQTDAIEDHAAAEAKFGVGTEPFGHGWLHRNAWIVPFVPKWSLSTCAGRVGANDLISWL